MSKKFSDENTAAGIANIIRRTIATPQSVAPDVDWGNEANEQELEQCIAHLNEYDAILREKFSDAEISRQLVTMIGDFVRQFTAIGLSVIRTQEVQQIIVSIKSWRTKLAANHEQTTFYAVIDGVIVDGKISLGLVKIEPLTLSIQRRVVSQFASKVRASPNFTPKSKKETIADFKKRTSEFFLERERVHSIVVSTIIDTWDKDIGQEEAHRRFEEVTNFIRYMGFLFSRPPGKIGVSLRGELGYEGKSLLGMADRVLFSQHFTAHHYPVGLSKDTLKKARDLIGVFQVPVDARNEFEQKMVSAINWAGKGCIEAASGDQLVAFCIALEILLKGDSIFGYTNTVCERVSFLLPRLVIQQFPYNGKICDRQSFYELMRNIFSNRGDVVHEGNEHLGDRSRQLIVVMAFVLYSVLITIRKLYKRNGWDTMKPLFKLLTARKFGLSPLPEKKL